MGTELSRKHICGRTRPARVRAAFAAAAVAAVTLVVAFPGSVDAQPAGLVAAYAFDEGSGPTAADASGSGNTGTLVNATWTAAGKDGGALVFNGTNARVDVPSTSSLQLTTGMTLEAWVKPTVVTAAWRDVIYKAKDNIYLEGTSDRGGGVPVAGGIVNGSPAEATGPTPLTAGNWAFLTETYDGSTLSLYVNGTLVASSARSGALATSTNPLQIGGDSSYGQYFNGTIDDVRIYNSALTAAQISTDMTTPVGGGGGGGGDTQPPSAPGTLSANAPGTSQVNLSWGPSSDNVAVTGYLVERCQGAGCSSFAQIATTPDTTFTDSTVAPGTTYGYRVRATDAAGNLGAYSNTATATTASGGGGPTLVAAYGFEAGSGPSAADSSGNGNTGQLVNATWTPSGKFGSALSFNGTNARVNIPDSTALHLTTGMTLEAWVNPAAVTSNWKDVIYKPNDNYYLEGTSDNSGRAAGGGTFGGRNANAFAGSALPVGTWSYLALTYDGTTVSLYVNGNLAGTAPASGSIAGSTSALQIGGDSLYGQFWNGLIDEVRIYNGALTVGQIQSDMTTPVVSGGGGGDTQPPSAPGTLTATAAGSGQINLSWGAANDNVGVTGYNVERCQGAGCSSFAQIGTSSTTSFSDTGLTASTSYSYRVRATDAAGNLGAYSNVAGATTSASTGGGGLVAAYGFEEGSGSTTADSSGNGNNGTLVNAGWTTAGKYGNALSLNGTSARVDVPDAASLHLTTGMTLEAWVNPTTVSNAWRDVIYKGNDNYYLEATSTTSSLPAGGGTFGGTGANVKAASALPVGMWSYIAVTYDGANLRVYVNGVLSSSAARTGAIATSTNPLQIGGDSMFSQYFAGAIDDVRIYNTALTAGQIQTDMVTPIGAPTAPGNLAATAVSASEVDLSWTSATDLAGIASYRVERCAGAGCSSFTQIGTPTGTSFSDTTVSANTSYSYRVRAVDTNGKVGPYSNVATAYTGLQLSPHAVALTPGMTQQYTATPVGGGSVSVNWSVDGIAGGNASVGTISASGVYTTGTSVGRHTVTATTTDQSQSANADAYITNYAGNFTFHGDNLRTGQNLSETVLTPGNVNSTSFGKLFSYSLDGIAFASPLYVENLSIPGQGVHNVVYVATEHDSVYAFDADGRSSTPLWKDSFINPAAGVNPVPPALTGETKDIPNEIGITGTPVIDPSTKTMYVVTATAETSGGTTSIINRLHALDITTGAEKLGSPVGINPSVPGTGVDAVNGVVSFNNRTENQRAALTLANGELYIAFANHGFNPPYHGWLLAFNPSTLHQDWVFCTSPDAQSGGVWMGGDGIGVDASGSLFFSTGNGTFDAGTGGRDYGDTLLRLNTNGTVGDYFTPYNYQALDTGDIDLASGGLVLLPDQPGAHPHEVLVAGKGGTIYVVDRDNMGHVGSTNDSQIVQSLINIFPTGGSFNTGNYSSPVYFNGAVFYAPVASALMRFSVTNGLLSTSPTSQSPEVYNGKTSTFSARGGAISVSANGSSNGILWGLQSNGDSSPGTLHAYSPANLQQEYYTSDQAGTRDQLDPWLKFTVPVVANGHVYVVSQGRLTVYGLLP